MKLKRLLLVLALALSLPSATLAVWPGADVNTTTFDSDTDSPLLARPDWFDHAVKFNQVRNHVSTFAQTVLDDIDAAAARATLGAAGTGVANTFTADQAISKAQPILKLIDTQATADNGRWRFQAVAEGLQIATLNDAETLEANFIRVERTATVVDSVTFPGTAVSVAGTLNSVGTLSQASVPVVTTTDAQTLTNKTLTSPTIATITGPTNVTSTLSEAGNRVYSLGNPPPSTPSTAAYAYLTTNTTVPINTAFPLPMNAELYDDAAIHDLVTNNTRFTVPAGFTRARFIGQCRLSGNAAQWRMSLSVFKNGVALVPTATHVNHLSSSEIDPTIQVDTGWRPVIAGDFFELIISHDTAVAQVTGVNLNWGSLELR